MRERLDCVMLGFGDMADWKGAEDGVYARGRLYLHRIEQPGFAAEDAQALAQLATHLQRFDVCLLSVGPNNLARIRQLMLRARSHLRTPVIGFVRNLKAPAIGDLYNLGMADFVREPFCVEEIRVRTERLLDHLRPIPASAYAGMAKTRPGTLRDKGRSYQSAGDARALTAWPVLSDVAIDLHSKVSNHDAVHQASDLALEAYARASVSQCVATNDSFGAAKGRAVQCFERSYIHTSLAKSSGNIAQAARGAKKHRRAFWALMRKHNIDAAPYRKVMPPNR